MSREEAPVAKVIVSVTNNGDTEMGNNVKLMAALVLSAPEAIVCKKELLGLLEQASVGSIVKVVGLLKSGEVMVNELEFFVGMASLGVGGGNGVVVDIGIGVRKGKLYVEAPSWGALVSRLSLSPTHHL